MPAATELDVAIVGGGPAGAWAAHQLARAGARVAVFDPSHPREKPCGGGVTGRALAAVADAVDVRALDTTPIVAARFGDSVVPLDEHALVVASRSSFDAALLDAAERQGASVRRSRVAGVAVGPAGVTITAADGIHRAAYLIGADGATSLVRRRVARAFRRDQLSMATGFYARGVTSREIQIEFTACPGGYLWSFPRPDHLAIGICAQADAGYRVAELRALAADWTRRTNLARDAALVPYSWPIPSLGLSDFARIDPAGERWMLVGDAAGLVDPITREGIFFALESGAAAAAALIAGSAAGGYAAALHRDIVPELQRAARLKAAFFTPPFLRLLPAALQSASVRAVMADLIAGRQPYRTLKWRLLKTFEVALAWRALGDGRIRQALREPGGTRR